MVGYDGSTRIIEPGIPPLAARMAHGVDRIRASGNGQIPIVAATAWRILTDAANLAAVSEHADRVNLMDLP